MFRIFRRTFLVLIVVLVEVCFSQVRDDIQPSIKRSVDITKNYRNDLKIAPIIGNRNFEEIQKSSAIVKNVQCKKDLNTTLWAVLDSVPWAISMYDSSVKVAVGVESGSLYQFGNFDECVDSHKRIIAITDDGDQRRHPIVMPKYCLADVTISGLTVRSIASRNYQPTNSTTVHWAVCVPKSCTSDDIQLFMKNLLNYDVKVSDENCYDDEEAFDVTTGMIIYSCVILCFMLMVIFSTFYDLYLLTRRSSLKEPARGCFEMIMKSFSAIENLKKLVQRSNDHLGMNAINGIKALAMLCILCGHTLLFIVGGPVLNSGFFAHDIKLVQNGFLLNSPLFVDTFLLLSGFLFCRILLKELEHRKGKINVLVIYVFRYIRLTPAYLAVIAFYITWLPKIGSGPLWKKRITLEQERCEKSWWLNLLYVNNYFGTENLCMFQSWYLSADTQLFVLAPSVIYLLYKNRKVGIYALSSVVVLTAILPFAITYTMNLDPTLLGFADEVTDISSNSYFSGTYIKTHMRATAYVFGLLTGFLLHYIQERSIQIPRKVVVAVWIFSLIVGLSSMFSITIFFLRPFNSLESALYAGLHRVGWSFFSGWVVLSVCTGNAGFLKSVLSSGVFVPLSRLTYCAYLSNGLIELYQLGTLRTPVYTSRIKLLGEVTSHNALTFLLALILCLLFESPIHGIEKIFLRKDRPRSPITNEKDLRTPNTSNEPA